MFNYHKKLRPAVCSKKKAKAKGKKATIKIK